MKKRLKFEGEEKRKFADTEGFPYASLHELAKPYAKKSEYEKGLFQAKLHAKERARLIKIEEIQTRINVLEVKRDALLYTKPTIDAIVLDYRSLIENYDPDDINYEQEKLTLNALYNVLLQEQGAKEIGNYYADQENDED